MRCVVTIPWMSTIIALDEVPEGLDDLRLDGLEVEEGAWVEIPPDVARWPIDRDRLADRTLGRCRTRPTHYKLFPTPRSAEDAGFEPSGMIYGGVYSPKMWERFATLIPSLKASDTLPDDDPPGAGDLALSDLRRAR